MFEINKFKKNFASVFFSDQKRYKNIFEVIKNLPKNSLIIFREYDLSEEKRQELAQEIILEAKKYQHKVLIGKSLKLALDLGANGVHFSDFDKIPLALIKKKNFKKDFIFSYATHNLHSVLKAKKLKNDLTFISPIFSTKSHDSSKTLGIRGLRKIIRATKKPIHALGGINSQNIKSIRASRAAGIAGIDIFC